MVTQIELILDADESDYSQLCICLNDQQVSYTTHSNIITASCDLDYGIHQLSLNLIDGTRIHITDVRIDSVSLRKTIYMSYVKTPTGHIYQPATALWNKEHTWVLPFGNPVSYWISLVSSKIQHGDYGKNLYEIYNIIYPVKMKLRTDFPKIIKDFFEHNFDFFCSPKTNINLLPQRKSTLDISQFHVQPVLAELEKNYQWIVDHQKPYPYDQKKYNDQEWGPDYARWIVLFVYKNSQYLLPKEQFPLLYDLIKSLPINGILYAYIGLLEPGAVIAPHVDNKPNHRPGMFGCNQLYIPLSWPTGNYFKFASGGMLDSDTPYFINVTDHVHGLINDSPSLRVVLGIICNPDQNLHLMS
jgi:hypothetical protein